MDRLTAMRVFVAVVDAGSLSAAADKLDLSRPVVTRYIAELEQWTGARLLHRDELTFEKRVQFVAVADLVGGILD